MKRSFLVGLFAMLVVGFILAVLAGCGSSPSSPNYTPQTAIRDAYNAGDLAYLAGTQTNGIW